MLMKQSRKRPRDKRVAAARDKGMTNPCPNLNGHAIRKAIVYGNIKDFFMGCVLKSRLKLILK